MATYNDGLGYSLNSGLPCTQSVESIMEVVLDIPSIVAARLAASAAALADGDVLEALALPAQCLVLAVGVEFDGEGDAGLTAAIGDDGDTAGFVAATAADAASNKCSVGGGAAFAAGKYYDAANTIDVLLAGAVPLTGNIRVWAKVVDGAGQVAVSRVPGATPENT